MKNNISYYSHDTDSHSCWKFRALRRKFGWAGEGRFWALNNMIGEAENCWLDLTHGEKLNEVAAELELTTDEFNTYIDFLNDKCKLIIIDNGAVTTDRVQETLNGVMKKREYQSGWKKKKSIVENGNSNIENTFSNIETEKSIIDFEQSKVKKNKVNKNKDRDIGGETSSPAKDKDLLIRRKQEALYKSLLPFLKEFGKDTLRKFYDYWSEPNKSKTRIRWELEKTWDTHKRLLRWASNDKIEQPTTSHPQQPIPESPATRKLQEKLKGL